MSSESANVDVKHDVASSSSSSSDTSSSAESKFEPREVQTAILSVEQAEGQGARVRCVAFCPPTLFSPSRSRLPSFCSTFTAYPCFSLRMSSPPYSRSIGGGKLRNFDPFLMMDEFTLTPPGGFPDHPHRGFETVTYILPGSKGTVEHEDFCGHRGVIGAGDLQWMTAGRGIVHAEARRLPAAA